MNTEVIRMIQAIMKAREITINGWIVKQDGHKYIVFDKHGVRKYSGSAEDVYTFVTGNK